MSAIGFRHFAAEQSLHQQSEERGQLCLSEGSGDEQETLWAGLVDFNSLML